MNITFSCSTASISTDKKTASKADPIFSVFMDESSDEEEEEDEREGEDDEEDDEYDLEGHQADNNFSSAQLDWIESSCSNLENFIMSYGFRFYDENDVKETKAIVDAFIGEDKGPV
ncbi:hypothetical protein BU26DRAFT_564607 [Trematosphaeria pertusa]|uniref:Uncharacterized protein n=1 Tax=Trematosphaeria pertusa TaxID=390896 RepID=A0A6A6IFE7_9PLEO|nr:uncharacterized protein BU26DRAFT_564607 [Trematosphaeria pertusa]KAF2248917.1 hypothetical protein BU26DRAFT_564607 [Trematosphaeria pertusa]